MRKNIGWTIMTLLSLLIVLLVSRYLTLNPEVYFPEQRAVYLANQTAVILHVVGGMLTLGLGPFNFLTRLREKRPFVHRWIGRVYLLGVLVGGLAGLYMSTFAYTGIVATLGFASLAVLWLSSGFMALREIRQGNVDAHRRWMVRNFALTFAAVTLRIEMGLLTIAFGQEVGYMIVAWLCWLPNLLIVEWWMRRQSAKQQLAPI